MDLSSNLSGAKEFRIVKRGYDPDEVNAFLDQIALGVGELKRKLAAAEDEARRAASVAPDDGALPDERSDAEAEEIHRALILAQRAADEEVRKATDEGRKIVSSAEEQARALTRQAEQEVVRRRDEGRADLLAEIGELEAVRDALANDVVVLEQHVDEQREVVQAAIGELQSLLDHPEAFRVAVASVSTVSVPAAARVGPRPDDDVVVLDEDDDEEGPDVDLTDGAAPEPAPDDGDDATSASLPFDAERDGDADSSWDDEADADDSDRDDDQDDPGEEAALDAGDPADAGDDRAPDAGPPTEAVDPAAPGAEGDDDDFLAELRKAMLDEEPLGPRDDLPPSGGDVDDITGGRRPRFGRRR